MATDVANTAARNGSLPTTIQSIVADLKPEAAYFYASEGMRTGLLIFDLQDPSQIPAVAEPWFLAFNAKIEIQPVMIPADLAKAGPAMEAAVKKYK